MDEFTADGDCSIREAFRAANLNLAQDACPAGSDADTDEIVLPAGTFTLTRPEVEGGVQSGFSGDLDIANNAAEVDLIVTGAGAGSTILEACTVDQQTASCPAGQGIVDRVLEVHTQPTNATVRGVTLRHGNSPGSAILNMGTLTVEDTVITAHVLAAILNPSPGVLTLNDSEVSNVRVAGGHEGAIHTYGALTVNRSTIRDNVGSASFGIYVTSAGATATVNQSTISGNRTGSGGAGLRAQSGTIVVLNNTTISGNVSSLDGAGLLTTGNGTGSMAVNGCTVTDNRLVFQGSFNEGAGIAGHGAPITLRNTIVAGNFDDSGTTFNPPVPDCIGTVVSQGYNLIGDADRCTGFVHGTNGDQAGTMASPLDPGLELLADNGGGTETHALAPDSLAIDRGNPAGCMDHLGTPFLIDQTGGARSVDGDEDGVPRCDVGAFERNGGGVSLEFALRPAVAGNEGRIAILFYGAGFANGADVRFVRDGEADVVADEVLISADGERIATFFDLTGRPLGLWDAVVTNPGGEPNVARNAFTIASVRAPELWADVVGPATVRGGRPTTFHVLYGNRGNVAALAAPLVLGLPRDFAHELRVEVLPPPPQVGLPPIDWERVPLVLGSSSLPDLQAVSLLLPAVPPGFVGSFEIRLTAPANVPNRRVELPIAFGDSWVHGPLADPEDVERLVGGARAYAHRVLHVGIPADRIPAMRAFAAAQLEDAAESFDLAQLLLGTAKPYAVSHLVIGLAAAFGQAQGVEICVDDLDNDGDDLIDEADPDCQRENDPSGDDEDDGDDGEDESGGEDDDDGGDEEECEPEEAENPWYADDDCDGEPDCKEGGFNTCAPEPCTKWPPTACSGGGGPKDVTVVNSHDPNDKAGSVGAGEAHYVTGVDPFPYAIQFENLPAATAPAQEVVITDELDPATMDLSTLRLGPIGFGDTSVVPPPGSSAYTTEVDLRPAKDLLVRIEANLDEATSVLTWRFTSLDPETGELPEDPFAGFLPPNVDPPEGQGSVLFTVDPVPGLPTGTEIRNQASIVFDVNEPIVTPAWINTIDVDEPSSRVDSATTGECSQAIAVAWSGTDPGSGIQSYDVLVSEDGGPFTVWRNDTTSTSGTFRGKWGRSYGFASVARDGAGHVEDSAPSADVSATVPDCGPFDIAVTKILVPKNVTLTEKKPAPTVLAKVQIQNRSAEPQTIASLGVLRELVSLEVDSLGACPAPEAILLSGKPQKARPITMKSKQTLNVAFELTFGCANDPRKSSGRDPGHEDYEVRAVVDQSVLGGEDAFPADDACPRIVPPPGVPVPYPDGKITDKGCGTKRPDRTFGEPVKVDVADKR